jgi:hypothetical protein
MWHAALESLIDFKKFVPERRIDLEEDRLPLGFVFVAGRVVLPELFRWKHGGDQRFGNQREVKMNGHDGVPSPSKDYSSPSLAGHNQRVREDVKHGGFHG